MANYMSDQNQLGYFIESGTYANASGALQWIGLVNNHDIIDSVNIFV